MTIIKRLILEAHRRSLWQVLGVYALTSWVTYEVVLALVEGFGLPDWVAPTAVVLLLVGLPIVLATALVQEGAPVLKREEAPESLIEGLEPLSETVGHEAPGGAAERPSAPGTAPTRASVSRGPGSPRALHGLLTWPKAITGGVLAFAALGLITTGFMGMRALGIGPVGSLVAKGVLEEQGQVLLGDFGSQTGDTLLAAAVTEAFRVNLEQSNIVRVSDPAEVAATLRQMQRDATERVSREVAREVALRGGMKAYVAGEANRLGSSFVLSARLAATADGATLASFSETARDSTEVVRAVERLANGLRERIGESLKSIRSNPPLERATTASLEALRAYTQGVRVEEVEGDGERALALLEEAVALDTAFAMAYRKMAVILSNMGIDVERQLEAYTRAFRHRDRLTTRERHFVSANYYLVVEGDRQNAIAAYEALLETSPDDYAALNNLGVQYEAVRNFARAETVFARGAEAPGAVGYNFTNLAGLQFHNGRPDHARLTLEEAERRTPGHPLLAIARGHLLYRTEGPVAARHHWQELAESGAVGSSWERAALSRAARSAAVAGRLVDADTLIDRAITLADREGQLGQGTGWTAEAALWDALVRRRPDRALARLEARLARAPLADVAAPDRPYVPLARAFAEAGRPERARELLAAYDSVIPAATRRLQEPARRWAVGVLALTEGDPVEGARLLQLAASEGACLTCAVADLGRAEDQLGSTEAALDAYERFLSTRQWGWIANEALSLAFVLERAAELREARGDHAKAAEHYARLVELWADADPELQPRVEAARRRLQALVAERA